MEHETRKHIQEVGKYLSILACELLKRAISHDKSKTEEPEKSIFERYTRNLTKTKYGSKEYNTFLKKMKPALDHHYQHNRHHPEYNTINNIGWVNDPIRSMDLVDILEMLCDWLASTKRNKNGCIGQSIGLNEKRFGINSQLSQIFRNTAASLEEKEKHF